LAGIERKEPQLGKREELNMETFVDREQMAEQLKIPAATVDYLRRERGLPHVWVGKHCRYVPSDVVHWVRSGQRG